MNARPLDDATTLDALLALPPYQAYSYSYPHKTAYRPLPAPVPLRDAWGEEDRSALFLYLHIPFCSYRCGFCNLFALARPTEDTVARYLDRMRAQLRATVDALGAHRFARFALGGGTPSYLTAPQLDALFRSIRDIADLDPRDVLAGMEVSPETVDGEKMALCREAGIDRISMGIQSFVDAEVRSLVRPQQRAEVERAIRAIRDAKFPTLNLDLIYGIAGQTTASFLASIDSALAYAPEEIYLYPLYVRPLTGLGRIESREGRSRFALRPEPQDDRAALYRAGRDALLAAGYRQISMRMFRAAHAPDDADAPAYCCQDDGMVGIGCGARSYTRALHYSSEYGVSRRSVADILEHYLRLDDAAFAHADYGIALDGDEQRRRYVIQSLLIRTGLDRIAYRHRFGGDCLDDLPQLRALQTHGLATIDATRIAPTDEGLARADTLGPWLISPAVADRMRAYAFE
ncbi:MAG: coproporphyrinogen III oxidase family protein [Lysobacter sp.]|nr:MAG: coproporphyrinogen III oxidase family protein [Lysobacter sp.]